MEPRFVIVGASGGQVFDEGVDLDAAVAWARSYENEVRVPFERRQVAVDELFEDIRASVAGDAHEEPAFDVDGEAVEEGGLSA